MLKKIYNLKVLIIIGLILISWFIGFLAFTKTVFNETLKPSKQEKKDGIIVLTGGRNRISKGANLINKGLGERVLISGVQTDVKLSMIEKSEKTKFDNPQLVDLGYEARDTVGNAKEVKEWVMKHQYQNLYVVTSFYHIPRSKLELEKLLPAVNFEFVAVNSSYVRKIWWLHLKSFSFLAMEYTKFLIVWVQYKMLGM